MPALTIGLVTGFVLGSVIATAQLYDPDSPHARRNRQGSFERGYEQGQQDWLNSPYDPRPFTDRLPGQRPC